MVKLELKINLSEKLDCLHNNFAHGILHYMFNLPWYLSLKSNNMQLEHSLCIVFSYVYILWVYFMSKCFYLGLYL